MEYLQAIFSGLAIGSIYALVAFGFSITYTTTRTFNFGQGEFLALGSLCGFSVMLMLAKGVMFGVLNPADVTGGAYLLALLFSLLLMGVLGAALYFAGVRHFLHEQGLSWVMSTLGFGIIVQNVALALWGPAPVAVPSPLGDGVVRLFGAGVRPQEILVFGVTLALMAAIDQALRRTRLGSAVRAVAFSRSVASLMGINVEAVAVGEFVLSAAMAGVAGVLLAPITTASAFIGLALALKAFSAAILGGLDSPRGCIAGGFLLGLLESLIGLWRAELRDIVVFALIIAVLYVRPAGLLGTALREKI